jgi:hypothetical protein
VELAVLFVSCCCCTSSGYRCPRQQWPAVHGERRLLCVEARAAPLEEALHLRRGRGVDERGVGAAERVALAALGGEGTVRAPVGIVREGARRVGDLVSHIE